MKRTLNNIIESKYSWKKPAGVFDTLPKTFVTNRMEWGT